VVIVEGGVDAAESMRELLKQKRFEVVVTRTGPERVELCRQLLPVGVVCDLGLPGMTGFDVVRAGRLDVIEERRVTLALPGVGPFDGLIIQMRRDPSFAWAELTPLAPVASRAG
jgi:CheY-like chemotaxis protein